MEIGIFRRLLTTFSAKVLNYMDQYGGVYLRDEGDRIISLFSSYSGLADRYAPVDNFCKAVVRARYGIDQLDCLGHSCRGRNSVLPAVK